MKLKETFGVETNLKSVYSGRWYRILFNSLILHRLLNNLFEMPFGYKKGKLRLPQLLKEAPFEIKKNFLIGFFDGDGWCSKRADTKTPMVSVSQSSKEILLDLKEILSDGGIDFKLYKKFSNNYFFYVLETKDKNKIKKFKEVFGFRHPLKINHLNLLLENFNKSKEARIYCSSFFLGGNP